MNKYALLQAPDRGQVVIIDNSTTIGKNRVYKFCREGYTSVGTIESELSPIALKSGFMHDIREEAEFQIKKLSKLVDIVEEFPTMTKKEFEEKFYAETADKEAY